LSDKTWTVASKTLTGRQLDMLYAVADNRTDAIDMLCSDQKSREASATRTTRTSMTSHV
jgi:hypothetical protein